MQRSAQDRPAGCRSMNGKTKMEECFYCGEQASKADIDRLGKCSTCMTTMTRAAEAAARESQSPCYTVGPNPQPTYFHDYHQSI